MTPAKARIVLDALKFLASCANISHNELESVRQAIAIMQAEVAALPVGMVEPIAQFIASQEPLGAEVSKVLHDNLDSLYETKEPTK